MTALADLLASTYSHDGMGPRSYNCWGIVRAGLREMFGLPLLPAFGSVHPDDKPALTAAWGDLAPVFEECHAEPGALACMYEGALLVHVGLVIERRQMLYVLHTNESTGPVQTPVRHASLLATTVRYYRYIGSRA